VPAERPTLEQLIALAKSDPRAIAELVLALWDRVEALEAKVASLERNSRNSSNSSKPPSSDSGNFTNPPKPRSLRRKSGRKPGGQKGHPGDTLRQAANPDRVVEHRIGADQRCPECGEPLGTSAGELHPAGCECRQVFDLPAIRIEVTEHRAERRVCGACGTQVTATFPEGVNAPVQYGEGVQSAALYLGGRHLIPFQRLPEVFADLFGCVPSTGTLANFVKRGGAKAGKAMRPVREALVLSEVAHADETGCRVKRSKALNLLIRLEDRYEETMGFFGYGHVPFDNKLAERDLRMMKTREKICLRPSSLRSGCGTFRSAEHPRAFCDIRSVISCARKLSRDVLATLRELLKAPTELGESLARGGKG